MRAAQSQYTEQENALLRGGREEGGESSGRGEDRGRYYTVKRREEDGMDECKPFRVGRDTEEDTEYDTPWGRMPVGVVTNDRATGIYLSDGASRV